jgi:Na+/proline symporter
LLATFLLGMTSRRSTSSAALLSLSCGALVTLGLAISGQLAAAGVLPEGYQFSPIWPALGGFAFTFVVGHLLSFIAGRPKSNAELRGLVVGCGELGRRATDEAIPLINIADESAEIRWR